MLKKLNQDISNMLEILQKNKCKIVLMQRTVTEISYSSVKNIILLMYEKIAFFSWNKKLVMLLYISNILLRVEMLWKKLKR